MRRALLPIVALIAMLTGCDGHAERTAIVAAPAEAWDPCTLPAKAIQATGLDSTTMSGWDEGLSIDDWSLCYWRGMDSGAWYHFGIRFSAVHTVDEISQNPAYFEVPTPDLASRRTFRYHSKQTEPASECNIAVETATGVANFNVRAIGGRTPASAPCEVVLTHARDLESYLPSSPN